MRRNEALLADDGASNKFTRRAHVGVKANKSIEKIFAAVGWQEPVGFVSGESLRHKQDNLPGLTVHLGTTVHNDNVSGRASRVRSRRHSRLAAIKILIQRLGFHLWVPLDQNGARRMSPHRSNEVHLASYFSNQHVAGTQVSAPALATHPVSFIVVDRLPPVVVSDAGVPSEDGSSSSLPSWRGSHHQSQKMPN